VLLSQRPAERLEPGIPRPAVARAQRRVVVGDLPHHGRVPRQVRGDGPRHLRRRARRRALLGEDAREALLRGQAPLERVSRAPARA
jgi:hypothetical protein